MLYNPFPVLTGSMSIPWIQKVELLYATFENSSFFICVFNLYIIIYIPNLRFDIVI